MSRTGLMVAAMLVALPATAEELEVPFELNRLRDVIMIRAQVNGKPALLIQDTGATRTVLSPEILGIPSAQLKRVRFAQNGPEARGEAMWGKASLRLGEKLWRDRRVWVMNLEEISWVFGRKIDGLIWQDLLREFKSALIDFKGRRIALKE